MREDVMRAFFCLVLALSVAGTGQAAVRPTAATAKQSQLVCQVEIAQRGGRGEGRGGGGDGGG